MTSNLPRRFTLLQARNPGDRVRPEEQAAFVAQLGIDAAELHPVDVLRAPLNQALLDRTDVLLVGGSGEYSVLDDHPAIHAFVDFVAAAADSGTPMFASCFGFQALVLGLGGQVIADEDGAEVGTYSLEPTAAAVDDPVFGALPSPFLAQMGHKDRASRLPEGLVNLASSALCPFQAVKLPGRPVYATQFHPELTWLDNRQRFERYMVQYGRLFGQAEAQRKLDGHRPGPEANELMPRFVAHLERTGQLHRAPASP